MNMNDEKSISKKILLEQIINKTYESDKILNALEKELNALEKESKELSEINDIILTDLDNNDIKLKNIKNTTDIENNSIKLKNIQDDILEIARKLKL
jgi:hypothetical protein